MNTGSNKVLNINHQSGKKNLPGSKGEKEAQKKYHSEKRALAFYNNQMLNYLNPLMCEFIALQEMVFISTADAHGECDASFRAGLPGFVHILDNQTIAFPEYRGNGVMASIGNILENQHIGLVFIDFFKSKIGLHVNGRACIVDNEAMLNRPNIRPKLISDIKRSDGQRAECWILIKIEEAYIHCSKHIPRLKKLDGKSFWGTDDETHKGGDFFKAKHCSRL